MKNIRGFTLVEVLIVFAILGLIGIAVIGALNAGNLSDKGYDARRKKDINRIKVAFEEYFNDNDHYPSQGFINNFNTRDNCGHRFETYLNSWPCDPGGGTYMIFVGPDANNPMWYKILTNLRNKKDHDIPPDWYTSTNRYAIGDGTITTRQVNYGVSSSNVSWYDRVVPSFCLSNDINVNCYSEGLELGKSTCKHMLSTGCRGDSCFTSNNCDPGCQVDCCGDGCD